MESDESIGTRRKVFVAVIRASGTKERRRSASLFGVVVVDGHGVAELRPDRVQPEDEGEEEEEKQILTLKESRRPLKSGAGADGH